MIEIFDCEQGTEPWRKARAGIITASVMKAVLTKGEGKTRDSLIRRIAAEIVTEIPLESYSNEFMKRGNEQEPEARAAYALSAGVDPEIVGFIRNGRIGASPDCLIGKNGGAEIKTQRADLLIETHIKGEIPSEHMCQLQGTMMVAERDWWDIAIYAPKMPIFIRRAPRDNRYIATLRSEIDRCYGEIDLLVRRIKGWGAV